MNSCSNRRTAYRSVMPARKSCAATSRPSASTVRGSRNSSGRWRTFSHKPAEDARRPWRTRPWPPRSRRPPRTGSSAAPGWRRAPASLIRIFGQAAVERLVHDVRDHACRCAPDEHRPSSARRIARQLVPAEQPRPDRIVDVVVDVSDDVGDPRHLPFDRRRAMLRRGADRQAVLALRMARDAVAHFPGQVQPLPVVLEHVDDAQALLVVIEAAGHERAQHALAGVAERRVAQVVAERDRFGQLLVQAQHLGDRARDLRDFERVRQPRAVVVAGGREEHLRLVLQPAERLGVDDAIAIALERRADRVFRLGPAAGPCCRRSWPPAARESSRSRCSSSSRIVMASCADLTYVAQEAACRAASAPTPKSSASVWPRSANVVARAEIDACPSTRGPAQQHGDVLARVVGARRRRIVAVIGGDRPADRPGRSFGSSRASRAIEAFEVGGVPGTSLRWP